MMRWCSFRKELESFSFQKQIVFCYCHDDLFVLKIKKKGFKISLIVLEKNVSGTFTK